MTARPVPAGVREGASIRLIDTGASTGSWNMAVDGALMESVRKGAEPALRFYRWSPRCLSLGRNQPAAGSCRAEAFEERGINVVRRLTGGRAVLHDRELTYSVAIPIGMLGSPRATYGAINRAWVAGLRRLGVAAELVAAGTSRAPVPSLAPCFRDPAEGEVVVGDRKLIGSAQYCRDGVILQHGSLLFENDQEEVRDLLRGPGEVAETPAVLSEFCNPLPDWGDLIKALAGGWCELTGTQTKPGDLSPAEIASANSLQTQYQSVAWTWRR